MFTRQSELPTRIGSATPTVHHKLYTHLHSHFFNRFAGKFNTGYREIVVIRADLSKLVDKLEEVEDDVEERYRIDFGVEMSFESANLVAHIIYNVRTRTRCPVVPSTY